MQQFLCLAPFEMGFLVKVSYFQAKLPLGKVRSTFNERVFSLEKVHFIISVTMTRVFILMHINLRRFRTGRLL